MSGKSTRLFFILIFLSSLLLVVSPLFLAFTGMNFLLEEWGLISSSIIIFTIISVIIDFKKRLNSKAASLIVALGALTALLRIPFAPLPNVNPCTYLIICIGIAFGPHVGFFVGALTPLISNLILGHGPWTPLQMYAWGLIGGLAGMLNFDFNRWKLGVIGFIAGYFYGFIMNIWFWYSYLYPVTLKTFIIAEIQGLPFDTLHAIGNFAFLTVLGNKTLKIFNSFKENFLES